MLTKLIKHDIKSIGKLLLPLNALILLMAVVGMILQATGLFYLVNARPLLALLFTSYVIAMAVIAVVSYFYPIIHFYRNLFSRQGYLTFTLPVSSWMILLSKTIVGFGWYLINITVSLFSMWAISGFMRIPNAYMEDINHHLMEEIGMSFSILMSWTIGITFVSLLWSLLTAYFSISIGQLVAKHKIIASVATYVGIYTVMQILMTIVLIPVILRGTVVSDYMMVMNAQIVYDIITTTFYTIAVFSVMLSGLFYVFTGVIMKKKVNLD